MTFPSSSKALAPNDACVPTAPTMPHKALVRMRLGAPGSGDVYVPVDNPLFAS